MLIETPALT